MFGKMFSLNKFSLLRGLGVLTGSGIYNVYEVSTFKKKSLSISEIGTDESQLLRHEEISKKLIKLNNGDTNIPEIRYMDNFQDNGAYSKLLNMIILPKTGPVNDFVLAHEFGHWKLGHGSGMVELMTLSLTFGILGMAPVLNSVPLILGCSVILLPKYLKHGDFLARLDLDENEADKFAIEKGFAKEGYEFFKGMEDNINDTDHPLASHRTAQCYMKWKNSDKPKK